MSQRLSYSMRVDCEVKACMSSPHKGELHRDSRIEVSRGRLVEVTAARRWRLMHMKAVRDIIALSCLTRINCGR